MKKRKSGSKEPRMVGKYQLVKKIGEGSYSKVFQAMQKQDSEHEEEQLGGIQLFVALKIIAKEKIANVKLQENLNNEISIMRDYHHQNVTCLHDFFTAGKNVCLAMEFCAGGDLSQYIHKRGTVRESLAVSLLMQLAAGMAFLESKGVIHRDLKPQNLLLSDESDRPILKVADFGFAKHLGAAAMCQTPCGTPLYMAPEVYLLQDYDGKADVWSIGCIYFEMLVGSPPFLGSNHRELFMNIRSRGLVIPSDSDMSPISASLLGRLLEVSPARRATLQVFCIACGHLESSLGLIVEEESAAVAVCGEEQLQCAESQNVISADTSTLQNRTGPCFRSSKSSTDDEEGSFVMVQNERSASTSASARMNRLNSKDLSPGLFMDCEESIRALFLLIPPADKLVREARAYLSCPDLPLIEDNTLGEDSARTRAFGVLGRACALYLHCLYLLRRVLILLCSCGCSSSSSSYSFLKSVRGSSCRLFEQILSRVETVLHLSTSSYLMPMLEMDPTPELAEISLEVHRAADVQRHRGNCYQAEHLLWSARLISRCVSLHECKSDSFGS